MFTGIVTDLGEIADVVASEHTRRITVVSHYDAATIDLGASIAFDGVCLTVVAARARADGTSEIDVEAAPETLALTTAAEWARGRRLNLERALKIGDELGGHIVAGHVDGMADLMAVEPIGETTKLTFRVAPSIARFVAVKGSVCLDGTSLTVNTVDDDHFSVLLIPHTLAVTTWGERKAGDRINIEVDLMARYVARLQEADAVTAAR